MGAKADLITLIFGEYSSDVDMRALWQEIDSLKEAHAPEVMRLLFDEEGEQTGMMLKDVGQSIGVSVERIKLIRVRAIRDLQHPARIRRYVPQWDWR